MRRRPAPSAASVLLVMALAWAGCGNGAGDEATSAREPGSERQGTPSEEGGKGADLARALEQALVDRARHPRVRSAECRDSPRESRPAPGEPGRRLDRLLLTCAIRNRGATATYGVHVLPNGCFTAARRPAAGRDATRTVEAIQACGGRELRRAIAARTRPPGDRPAPRSVGGGGSSNAWAPGASPRCVRLAPEGDLAPVAARQGSLRGAQVRLPPRCRPAPAPG